jgi:hypothetical protein
MGDRVGRLAGPHERPGPPEHVVVEPGHVRRHEPGLPVGVPALRHRVARRGRPGQPARAAQQVGDPRNPLDARPAQLAQLPGQPDHRPHVAHRNPRRFSQATPRVPGPGAAAPCGRAAGPPRSISPHQGNCEILAAGYGSRATTANDRDRRHGGLAGRRPGVIGACWPPRSRLHHAAARDGTVEPIRGKCGDPQLSILRPRSAATARSGSGRRSAGRGRPGPRTARPTPPPARGAATGRRCRRRRTAPRRCWPGSGS